MNTLAKVGMTGAGIGMVNGLIGQYNEQKYDPRAGDIQDYAWNSAKNATGVGLIAMGGYAGLSIATGHNFKIKGKTIGEVAQSIAGSKPVQAIFPGGTELKQEINSKIASYVNEGSDFRLFRDNMEAGGEVSAKLRDIFSILDTDALESVGFTKESAEKIAKYSSNISADNLNDTIESIRKEAQGNAEFLKFFDEVIQPEVNNVHGVIPETVKDKLGTANYILNVPRAYMSHSDKYVRNSRIAASAVAVTATYAGLATAGRHMSGGTLTTDKYGRKDIAGIPFI